MSGIASNPDGRHPLNILQDNIAEALMLGSEDGAMPIVETTMPVIQHYNKEKGMLDGFNRAGYFVLRNVIVCQEGKKEEVRAKLQRSLDSIPVTK